MTAATVGVGVDWLSPLRDPALDPGAVLDRIAPCAGDFRAEFRATGTPDLIDTRRWTNPGTAPTFVHERITHRGGAHE